MLILQTIIHETIWGGARLAELCGFKSHKIGHLYSLISNGEFESVILNGEYKGRKFRDYFEDKKAEFGLEKFTNFPFLIALVDASEDLSLQVHPDDEAAKRLENLDFGKNESFYFLQAPKSEKIFMGSKAKNLSEFKEKLLAKKYDEIFDYLSVKKGDYVYIKAGTIHALSAGSLVYEIEENCNATYRIYDFERLDKNGKKRQIHLNEALNSIRLENRSKARIYRGEIRERFYSTQLFKGRDFYQNKTQSLECLTLLSGEFRAENLDIKKGTTIVLEPRQSLNLNKSSFIIAKPVR